MARQFAINLIALQLSFGFLPLAWSESTGSYEFFVVSDTLGATRIDSVNGSGFYPWEEIEYADAEVISGNCGIAEYRYKGITLEAFRRNQESDAKNHSAETNVAVGDTGHFCRLSNHLHEHTALLATRSWEAKVYIVNSTEIFYDNDGEAYVIDTGLVDEWSIRDLVKPLPDAGQLESCWCAKCLGPSRQETLEQDGYKRFGDHYCATSGVYIRDIATTANIPLSDLSPRSEVQVIDLGPNESATDDPPRTLDLIHEIDPKVKD